MKMYVYTELYTQARNIHDSEKVELGMVVYLHNPSYSGGRDRILQVQGQPEQPNKIPSSKNKNKKNPKCSSIDKWINKCDIFMHWNIT